MQINDTFLIKASPEKVWNILIDPQQLGRCMPGCEDLQLVDDTRYQATMVVKVQFMKLKFQAEGEMVEVDPYRKIAVELNGKPIALAGLFHAQLEATLTPQEDQTVINYHLDVQMTGRLASLGEAILRKTTIENAQEFEKQLRLLVETHSNC